MRRNHFLAAAVLSALVLTVPTVVGAESAPGTRAYPPLLDRWVQMYNTGDVSGADGILSQDFVPHMPALLGITDRASYLARIQVPGVLYPYVTLQDVFGREDTLVGRFSVRAVWPNNRPYTNQYIVFFRLENGLIAEEWWELDFLGVLEQIGQLPMTRSVYSWNSPSLETGLPGVPFVNAALARLSVEAINTRNLALERSLLSRDYRHHDVVAPLVSDRAGYEFFLQNLLAAFPDLHIAIEDTVAVSDRVAVRCTFTGTHLPTGKPVRWTSMTIFRFANNRIVDAWWAYDALARMTQLKP